MYEPVPDEGAEESDQLARRLDAFLAGKTEIEVNETLEARRVGIRVAAQVFLCPTEFLRYLDIESWIQHHPRPSKRFQRGDQADKQALTPEWYAWAKRALTFSNWIRQTFSKRLAERRGPLALARVSCIMEQTRLNADVLTIVSGYDDYVDELASYLVSFSLAADGWIDYLRYASNPSVVVLHPPQRDLLWWITCGLCCGVERTVEIACCKCRVASRGQPDWIRWRGPHGHPPDRHFLQWLGCFPISRVYPF